MTRLDHPLDYAGPRFVSLNRGRHIVVGDAYGPRSRPEGRAASASRRCRASIAIAADFIRANAFPLALGFIAGLSVTVGLADLLAATVLS